MTEYLPRLLDGLGTTLLITGAATPIAAAVAFVFGLTRMYGPRPLRTAAAAYVEFFRGTSLVVQLYWAFFALPLFGVFLSPFVAAILVLGFNVGSYGSEVVRGAVQSVPPGQVDAARALSMSRFDTIRIVVVPQALIAMMPPLGNLLVELFKATSLLSLVTISDLTFNGQLLLNTEDDTTSIYLAVMLMYLLGASIIVWLFRKLERHVARRTGVEPPRHALPEATA